MVLSSDGWLGVIPNSFERSWIPSVAVLAEAS